MPPLGPGALGLPEASLSSLGPLLLNVPSQHHLHPHVVGVCLVTQSRLTLCNPMDWSPPGVSVHEILQARIPEWVAISSSKGPS